jgi:hypothetical protein
MAAARGAREADHESAAAHGTSRYFHGPRGKRFLRHLCHVVTAPESVFASAPAGAPYPGRTTHRAGQEAR